jgi:hypothetical protein
MISLVNVDVDFSIMAEERRTVTLRIAAMEVLSLSLIERPACSVHWTACSYLYGGKPRPARGRSLYGFLPLPMWVGLM